MFNLVVIKLLKKMLSKQPVLRTFWLNRLIYVIIVTVIISLFNPSGIFTDHIKKTYSGKVANWFVIFLKREVSLRLLNK